MALSHDPDPKLAQYAHPERLVTTAWLAEHLDDPGLVVVESDEDILLYETGHIPGAVKVDWHTELNDQVTRDYLDAERFADLMRAKGIGRDATVVFYGDKSNWWAAYALWVFSLFGHPDLRLLDGGRAKWEAEGRPMTTEAHERQPADYPVVERNDAAIRAYRDDVLAHLGKPLVDVRSPDEFSGRLLHMANYPQEGAMRGGHIPGAKSVPWARAANEDGTFKSRADLEALYESEVGLAPSDDVVVYCRIGERSSHTWFALTHLLGFERVRNYDGSWTEWGNSVRVPIEREADPGVTDAPLPPALAEIVDLFATSPPRDRLELLLEYAQGLPPLPGHLAGHPELLEPVPECQSPLFVASEVDEARRVHVFFDAPQEAPTTRGFAGIFHAGLDGLLVDELLAVPGDVTSRMGLTEVVSPLRMRGASALLARVQRQVREHVAARGS